MRQGTRRRDSVSGGETGYQALRQHAPKCTNRKTTVVCDAIVRYRKTIENTGYTAQFVSAVHSSLPRQITDSIDSSLFLLVHPLSILLVHPSSVLLVHPSSILLVHPSLIRLVHPSLVLLVPPSSDLVHFFSVILFLPRVFLDHSFSFILFHSS